MARIPRIDQGAECQPMQRAENMVLWSLAGALLVTISTAATAQQPRPPVPPAQAEPAPSDTPQRTTATYANWILACETQPGPPPQKTCGVTQVVQAQVQGRTTPFSTVTVLHPVKGQPVKLVVQVPPSVTVSTNVHVQTADSDPGIAVQFGRCAPSGCFADFDIKDDMLKKFRAASGNGKVTYADAGGHDVVVPLSFSGFSQAFEALAKE
jgi:invasion protein IalB